MYFISATSNFMKFQLANRLLETNGHTHTHTQKKKTREGLRGNFGLTWLEFMAGEVLVTVARSGEKLQTSSLCPNASLWSGETESLFNKSFTC